MVQQVRTSTKRDWLFVGCEGGHDMQSIGGASACCGDTCACSVPVNACSRCGICDYGDNDDAREIRAQCDSDDAVKLRELGIWPA